MQEGTCGPVELEGPVFFHKNELDHPFVRADIHPFQFGGQAGRDGIAQEAAGIGVQAIEGEPLFQVR